MKRRKYIQNYKGWPAVVKPKENELFSSWITRVAHAHFLSTKHFCRIETPGLFLQSKDIDLISDKILLSYIGQKARLKIYNVKSMTIRPELTLFDSDYYYKRTSDGVVRTVHMNSGFLYCPLCLREPQPYFKKQWRYLTSFACTTHNVFLEKKCPKCDTLIIPFRKQLSVSDTKQPYITLCYNCNTDISTAKSTICPPSLIKIQTILNKEIFLSIQGKRKSTHFLQQFLYIKRILLSRNKNVLILKKVLDGKYHKLINHNGITNQLLQESILSYYSFQVILKKHRFSIQTKEIINRLLR